VREWEGKIHVEWFDSERETLDKKIFVVNTFMKDVQRFSKLDVNT